MIFWLATCFCLVLVARAIQIKPPFNGQAISKKNRSATCRLAVFLGSGGHTSECLTLLSSLDFTRYTDRIYFVSDGDSLSIERASALEIAKTNKSQSKNILSQSFKIIPRARQVHQSLLTTPFTAMNSLVTCLYHVCLRPMITRKPVSDVLIVNGPGTCVMLCIAVCIGRFLMVPTPITIYVESFARVKSLSLSGKLLRPLVDRFIVQWPELLVDGGRGEYHGWLV